MKKLLRFLQGCDAATAVEYAVLLGAIMFVVVGSIAAVGTSTGGLWGGTQTKLQNAGVH